MNNQPIAFISENGTLFKELPPLPINLIPLYKNSERINIELLKALEDMVHLASPNIYPSPDKERGAWAKLQRARAAISKAKGEK